MDPAALEHLAGSIAFGVVMGTLAFALANIFQSLNEGDR